MVIAVRAHCNPLDIYIYIYIYIKLFSFSFLTLIRPISGRSCPS